MIEAKHWTAGETSSPQAAEHGWAIYYDPTPGGRDNGDGTKSYGLVFPALILYEGLKDPEKVAHEIAEKLNRAETLKPST